MPAPTITTFASAPRFLVIGEDDTRFGDPADSLNQRDSHVRGRAIGHADGEALQIESGLNQPLDSRAGDAEGERIAGAGVDAGAEGEDPPVFPERIEALRVRIGRRVAVG